MMLHVFAEDHGLVDVKRVLQEYFCVERSSDIPAEALGELLIRIGLDEKGIAAIRTELQPGTLSARAGPLQAKGRWFEVGADVSHQEHGSGYGRVVLGSESLAENDGKVLVQFDDNEGGEHGPKLFIDPAQLQVTRIWHPIHGPGVFLFEEEDGSLNVFFDDKDGNSIVEAREIRPCVVLGKEYLAKRQGKLICHHHLGCCRIVGEEEDGKPIVIFANNDVSEHLQMRSPISTSFAANSVTETKLPDSLIASALGRMDKPFTVGEIAAEGPKPLVADHSTICLRDTLQVQEEAKKRAEHEAALDAIIMREFG